VKISGRAGLVISFLAFLCAATAGAAGPTGTVRDASGDVATIEISGDALPAVGDQVEIFFELAGTDTEVSVASGHVLEATAGNIKVKIDKATGTVEASQRARFPSGFTQKPTAPSPPPLTESSAPPKFSPPSPPTKSPSPVSKKLQPPKSQTPPPKKAAVPAPPAAPEADDAVPGALYAAVAYSPTTGKWGWGANYPSKNQAIARAKSECGSSDATAAWCRNAWVALALSDKKPGGFGTAWGATANAAQQAARKDCLKRNPDARIVKCVSSSGN
jgi:hypothetical protein